MTQIQKLAKLTGESDNDLLSLLLEITQDKIFAYTNRSILTTKLEQIQLQWALVSYNRLGTEGETSRSQGGISSTFADIPKDILDALNNNRLAKVGGKYYETTT